MDRWFLISATLLAVIGGVWGMVSVHRGKPQPLDRGLDGRRAGLPARVPLACAAKQRAACPLADRGEILVFLSWSLTLFYLLVGPAYRISLLGVFTAPVVVVFQTIALLPGVLECRIRSESPAETRWHETHSATSVLAYGALALAAVAGVMFLVLDRQLKEQHLKSGLFRNLPPVRELLGLARTPAVARRRPADHRHHRRFPDAA